MPAPLVPVESSPDLPTHADVVVIGGGIIGVFAAYYMAKRGMKVGYVDSTPDGVPGIGEMSCLRGLVLAAGFRGHGFGIGPGAGHLIADIVGGAEPLVDPRPYHPDRFLSSAWGKVADF